MMRHAEAMQHHQGWTVARAVHADAGRIKRLDGWPAHALPRCGLRLRLLCRRSPRNAPLCCPDSRATAVPSRETPTPFPAYAAVNQRKINGRKPWSTPAASPIRSATPPRPATFPAWSPPPRPRDGVIFEGALRLPRSGDRRADDGRYRRLDRLDDQGRHWRLRDAACGAEGSCRWMAISPRSCRNSAACRCWRASIPTASRACGRPGAPSPCATC